LKPRPSFWQQDWCWVLLLTALVFVAYIRVFSAGFIWDDESHLTQNPCVVGPLGLKEIWTSTRAVYYPLVLTTFWVIHKFAGLNPLPYHLLNVLLHAASAVLLWRILRQLRVSGAWLGAAFWALHPVLVQSVAWVTELKNTQSCFFYLLSIFCFLAWEQQRSAEASTVPVSNSRRGQRRSFEYILSVCCFFLATLSKPSVVMLPAVLALCIWWTRDRLSWRDGVRLAPFVFISALSSVWTIWEQKFHARAVGPDWSQTILERLIIAGRAIWFYASKLIWPEPLIFIYPRWQIHSSQLVAYMPLLAATATLILFWFLPGKSGRAVFFAAAYYAISLFPVLGFFNVYFFRYSFVSDHFQYLASMGPLALAGAGVMTACKRLATLASIERGAVLLRLAPSTILLMLLGFLTWHQTAAYRDLISVYTDTLAKNPACWMAHYNLGIVLANRGETAQAMDHYREAVALRPTYVEAHYNLGRLLAEKGEINQAIDHYEAALAVDPGDAEAQNNLGATLLQAGLVDDAVARYQKALAIRPDYAAASCNLADALLLKGDMDGAIDDYRRCVALLPENADAQYNLASALLRKGEIDDAITHYQKALELLPQNADAHANLGSAFLTKGRVADAIAQYREALGLAPRNVAAKTNLAWLLATSPDPTLRNGPEAVSLAEQATEASGAKTPLILRILAAAYAEAGRFSEARQTAHEALQAADDQGNAALSEFLRKELALYETDQPYHKQPR
jgi:protein O-mannosyl-transferase